MTDNNKELLLEILKSNMAVKEAALKSIQVYESPFIHKAMLNAEIAELYSQIENVKRYK